MKTVKLLLGKKNSGKSEFFEKEMSLYQLKLYVGTLGDKQKYFDIIDRHKRRRDNTWLLIETTCNIDNDIYLIKRIIEKYHVAGCLIDGLSAWAFFCCGRSMGYSAMAYIVSRIESLILTYDIDWRFIDNFPYCSFRNDLNFQYIVGKFHNMLQSRCSMELIIHKGGGDEQHG